MNYLAHLALSNNNLDLSLGNFMADSIQGNNFQMYSKEIQHGIYLHRAIDSFTDAHPIYRKAKQLFKKDFNHYSGIINDVIFDYYLAINWDNYFKISLREFTTKQYEILSPFLTSMPLNAQSFYGYMVQHDILYHYQYLPSIAYVLKGITHRAKAKVDLSLSLHIVENNHDLIDLYFQEFWLDLCHHVNLFLDGNKPQPI